VLDHHGWQDTGEELVRLSINPVFGPPYPELQERQRRMFESLGPIMDALKALH
jgi:hypothetical protein